MKGYKSNDKNLIRLPRQHLPQPDGRVHNERSGAQSGAGGRRFHIGSAATSREELGNPVYPPARRKLAEHGIACAGHAARQLTAQDYENYDLLIGMDRENLRNMRRICGGDPDGKLSFLLDHKGRSRDVADPWYTGDFEATWQDVLAGCQALLAEIR